jgi:DNA repair ATPase RecN
MIHNIKLRNFQRHEKLLLNLQQITTLVGLNDKGKTAVFRALYWLAMARPLGDSFIRFGAEKCLVEIDVDEHTIRRVRTVAGKSTYKVDGVDFKATGTSAPNEVQSLLRLEDVNFQQQLDPPFWFLESAGQLSKRLNEIINLEDIDRILAEAAFAVRANKSKLEFQQESVRTLEEEVEGMFWVTEFDNDVNGLEQTEELLNKKSADVHVLSTLTRQAEGIRDTIKRFDSSIAPMEQELSELQTLRDQLTVTAGKSKILADKIGEMDRLQELIQQPVPNIKQFDRDYKSLFDLYSQLHALSADCERMEQLFSRAGDLDDKLQSLSADLGTAELELKQLTGGVCPVCQNPLQSV